MNHTSGLNSTSRMPPGRGLHGQLERPSLFAGMEDGDEAATAQRVRILSTLESVRHPHRQSKHPNTPARGRHRKAWWTQAILWGLLALGLTALITGFAMVVQTSRPAPMQTLPSSQPSRTLPATSQKVATAADGAARIEVTEVGAPASASASASAAVPASARADAPTRERTVVSRAETGTAHVDSRPSPKKTSRDQDVALLEAMLAHTSGRSTPLSAKQEFEQRCAGLNGAERSACRTEVCAQHASAAVCR